MKYKLKDGGPGSLTREIIKARKKIEGPWWAWLCVFVFWKYKLVYRAPWLMLLPRRED